MLNSFVYSKFRDFLESRASRHGIRVYKVNPAFTSVIGRVKYATQYGLTVHHAAALVIARRLCRFDFTSFRYFVSERAPSGCRNEVLIPNNRGGHVTFPLPVRKRSNGASLRSSGEACMVILAARVQKNQISGVCNTGSGGSIDGPIQPNAGAFGWDGGATLSRTLSGAIPAHESLAVLLG